ncbi:unnamed protein product [Moneuplotes crassus]|uniref:Uncharacterized protein n=1 Tax=Euplotes crassus TaxID=5936 RepID=A0AAD1XS00_EUPCR|nr:unnamed protein product [Moneuplotes crassus]
MEPSAVLIDEENKVLHEEEQRLDFMEENYDTTKYAYEAFYNVEFIKYDSSRIYSKYNQIRKPKDEEYSLNVFIEKNNSRNFKQLAATMISYPFFDFFVSGDEQLEKPKISRFLPCMIKVFPNILSECKFRHVSLTSSDLLRIFYSLISKCELRFISCCLANLTHPNFTRPISITQLTLINCVSPNSTFFNTQNPSFLNLRRLLKESCSNPCTIRLTPNIHFSTEDPTITYITTLQPEYPAEPLD